MKTTICAIAKHENAYINDWVNYHLALGIDHIYLYDNNEDDYPNVQNFIEQKKSVTIIPAKTINDVEFCDWQVNRYNDFIENYSKLYDWCAFIDIDEYIWLDNMDIKTFLSKVPDNKYNIVLHWKTYGDDDIIEGDESIPVYNRIVKPKITKQFNVVKSIVNFKANPNYYAFSPHHFTNELSNTPLCLDCNLQQANIQMFFLKESYETLNDYKCYIKHYQTKTLSEFLKYKIHQHASLSTDNNIEYFFLINKKTPEKIKYIKDKLNIDLLNK